MEIGLTFPVEGQSVTAWPEKTKNRRVETQNREKELLAMEEPCMEVESHVSYIIKRTHLVESTLL